MTHFFWFQNKELHVAVKMLVYSCIQRQTAHETWITPLRRGSKYQLQISLLTNNLTSFQLICIHCTCLFFSSGCVFNRSRAACFRVRSVPHLWTYSYCNTFGGKVMEEWKNYWNQEGNLSNVRQKWRCLLLTPCILNESPIFFHTVESNGQITFPPTEHFSPDP